jgi:hypothetical protein
MIRFRKNDDRLELIYEVDFGSDTWVQEELDRSGTVAIRRAFYFSQSDLIEKSETGSDEDIEEGRPYFFTLGRLENGYFRIDGDKLGIDYDVYLSEGLRIDIGTFIANRGISVFRQIARVTAEPLHIGGDNPKSLPRSEFEKLLKTFPNSTELDHYARARVARILRDYFETTSPAEEKFEEYLRKHGGQPAIHDFADLYRLEVSKYEFIRDKVTELLNEQATFSENEWRDLMLHFILLIFPKYVAVLRNVLVKDYYSSSKPKNRYIDIALIDANGNIDIIEIKKPFEDCLISVGAYRGNFTPRKELSGSIMQAEKYLFHLSKWGAAGEDDINRRQEANLPAGLKIKIMNPKAIVIAGRSNALSSQQLFDFELIKRKYSNIVDILSYDDLLNRLSSIIEKFKGVA